jgi:tRNA A37 threonylcarbamoyladenosine modification protein TsaB
VPTLDAVAYQHREGAARLWVVASAGRGLLYAGQYRRWQGRLRREGDYLVVTPEELGQRLAQARTESLVAGELERAEVEAILGRAARARVATPAGALRRAAYLAELGLWSFAERGPDDAAALQPLYLRRGPRE